MKKIIISVIASTLFISGMSFGAASGTLTIRQLRWEGTTSAEHSSKEFPKSSNSNRHSICGSSQCRFLNC